MWIVNALIDGVFEHVSIPPGSWAVRIDELKDTREPDEVHDLYFYDTHVVVVGGDVHRLVLDEKPGDEFMTRACLYWSPTPFALIESWEIPQEGRWVHLATCVNEHGMTPKLPTLPRPPHATSRAGEFCLEHRKGSWTRLQDLADVLRVSPKALLTRHERHFHGPTRGIAVIYADTAAAVNSQERFELVWNVPDLKALSAHNPTHVWVRQRFVLVAAYLNMLGYTG